MTPPSSPPKTTRGGGAVKKSASPALFSTLCPAGGLVATLREMTFTTTTTISAAGTVTTAPLPSLLSRPAPSWRLAESAFDGRPRTFAPSVLLLSFASPSPPDRRASRVSLTSRASSASTRRGGRVGSWGRRRRADETKNDAYYKRGRARGLGRAAAVPTPTQTDRRTDGQTDGRTDRRTDMHATDAPPTRHGHTLLCPLNSE